jgi:Protein of unknown function (DUF3141)
MIDQIRTAFSAEKSGCTDAVNILMRQLARPALRQLPIDWGRGKSRVMSSELGQSNNHNIGPNFGALGPAVEYLTDSALRTIPSWDARLQRADAYREHVFQNAARFRNDEFELLVDGRTVDKPVNRCFERAGTETNPKRWSFVVADPSAGYGPFIGGAGRRPQHFAGAPPLSIDDVGIATTSPCHDSARLTTGETLSVDGGDRIIG